MYQWGRSFRYKKKLIRDYFYAIRRVSPVSAELIRSTFRDAQRGGRFCRGDLLYDEWREMPKTERKNLSNPQN